LVHFEFNENGHLLRRHDVSVGGSAQFSYTYNSDGELLSILDPLGARTDFTYYAGNHRPSRGNLSAVTRTPGPAETDQQVIAQSYVWEPIFNAQCMYTDPAGSSWLTYCDYFEGSLTALAGPFAVLPDLAIALGYSVSDTAALLSLEQVPMLERDLNGDGYTNKANGNAVYHEEPTVVHPFEAKQLVANLEGSATQSAITTIAYNDYGQPISWTDAEENHHLLTYYPENDPNGDGLNVSANPVHDGDTGGYLASVRADAALPNSSSQHAGLSHRGLSTDFGANSLALLSPREEVTRVYRDERGNVATVVDPRDLLSRTQ
ncbi:MAG: hypothetical protein AAFY15_16680, partial [Cyanobacteria bacterium J06648_11]